MPRARTPWTAASIARCGLLLLGCLFLGGPAQAAMPVEGTVLTLSDVLATSALDSPAACPAVDFDDALRGASTSAQADDSEPPNPTGPTPVDVSMFLLAVDEIETRSNSFRLEGYFGLVWCDPRAAFDPAEAGTDHRVVAKGFATGSLQSLWWPGLFTPSRLGEQALSNESVIVHADGTVRYTGKLHARFIARYDFSNFPFDQQRLQIPVQASLHRSDTLVLQTDERRTGFDPAFEIPEWTILGTDVWIDQAEEGGRTAFSRFVLEIRIGRKVGFYIWKVGLPLLLIFGVSWSVLWMTRDVLAQRQRQAATGLLTLVAYQFVVFVGLPRVSYLTPMDKVFLWSYVVMAAALVLNVMSNRRCREELELGLRFDRRARWLYPLTYLGGIVAILAWHLLQ